MTFSDLSKIEIIEDNPLVNQINNIFPTIIPTEELINEPLNRVLIVDKKTGMGSKRHQDPFTHNLWMEMNLIIFVDYRDNSFFIAKNRWGSDNVSLPLPFLGYFLFHPEITSEHELIAEMENFSHEQV